MFQQIVVLITLSFFLTGSALGQDRDRQEPKYNGDSIVESLDKIVGLGPGVHHIKTDQDGRVESCVIVGQSRISTALGIPKGLQMARSRAHLAVVAEFVKWLNQEVDIRETAEEENILSLEGSEKGSENDREQTLTESGKAVEKGSVRYATVSRGLIRGLQVLHVDVDGDGKVYTLVMGWSADGAAAAWQVENAENERSARQQLREKSTAAGSVSNRQATSADAQKFLD